MEHRVFNRVTEPAEQQPGHAGLQHNAHFGTLAKNPLHGLQPPELLPEPRLPPHGPALGGGGSRHRDRHLHSQGVLGTGQHREGDPGDVPPSTHPEPCNHHCANVGRCVDCIRVAAQMFPREETEAQSQF